MSHSNVQRKDDSSMTDNSMFQTSLAQADPSVFDVICKEHKRQQNQIELIASADARII